MKRKPKLLTGYILIYLALAWVFLSGFIPKLMGDFSWVYMILCLAGIGELTAYRKNKKRKRFRVGKEEYKYVKWLFVEILAGIVILTLEVILEMNA